MPRSVSSLFINGIHFEPEALCSSLRTDGESARRDMHTYSVHVTPYFVWRVQPILLHSMTAQGPESGMLTSGKVHASRSSKSSIWWSPLSDETGNFGTAAA